LEAGVNFYYPNPNRPPKKWFRDCVRGVRSRGGARDAEAVCGAVWYHELSPAARRRISRKSER
jgi:hypothetical protein